MRPWRTVTVCLLLLAARPASAFLSIALGDQRLFFLEPSLSEQQGELDAFLDTQSPDLEWEQFEGSALGAAYAFSIHTAGEGVKVRWDRYRVRADLVPGPLRFLGKTLRLGFGIRSGAEIRFLRHFGGGKEALKAKPMPPWILGSVVSILDRMRPGDMASIPVNAEFLLKTSLHTPIAGIPARPSIFLKLGGTFQMSLLRLRDERVRVRFLAAREHGGGAAFKAGFVWDAELIELLGEKVRFLAELNLLKTSWIRKWGKGVLLDATLDLSRPDARDAFEHLFYRPVQLATGGKKLLSVGWALIQELAEKDAGLDPEDRRAVLHRCGLLGYRQDAWKLKLGNALLRWGRKDMTTVLEFDPYKQDVPSILMASNLSAGKRTVFLRREGKWFHESQVFARKQGGETRVALWVLRYRVKDRRFVPRDLERLRERMHKQLGPDLAPELPDLPEGQEPYGKAEVTVRLSRKALEELAAWDERALADRFDAWIRRLDLGVFWRQGHAYDMVFFPRKFLALLRRALDDPDEKTLGKLARFRETNRAFGDIGVGFLLHLLEPREDDDRLSVYCRYKAVDVTKKTLRMGSVERRPSEEMIPIMRFLETGIIELQREAAEIALRDWAVAQETEARVERLDWSRP